MGLKRINRVFDAAPAGAAAAAAGTAAPGIKLEGDNINGVGVSDGAGYTVPRKSHDRW